MIKYSVQFQVTWEFDKNAKGDANSSLNFRFFFLDFEIFIDCHFVGKSFFKS